MGRLFIRNSRVVQMINQMNNQNSIPREDMPRSHNTSKINRYYNQIKINKFLKVHKYKIKLLKRTLK